MFYTELFARPHPRQSSRPRQVPCLFASTSSRDIADAGVRPADFPRIARQAAARP